MAKNTPDNPIDPPRRDLPERTFAFAKDVVALCISINKSASTVRPLITQLLRCATSVGANVEEGQGSHSRADFAAKYGIACKEAREARYWLRLLATTGLVETKSLEPLVEEARQLVAILTTIVRKVKRPADEEA